MADTSTTTEERIKDALEKPKSVSIDGMTVNGHDVSEIIQADKYLRTLEAMKQPHKGIRFTSMNSGSSVK